MPGRIPVPRPAPPSRLTERELRDLGARFARQLERQLRDALADCRAAQASAASYCDTVSELRERALGIGLDDPRKLEDPEYGQTLDRIWTPVRQAMDALQKAIESVG